MKSHMPIMDPGCVMTHAQPRMLGHPVFLVQKPRQVVWKGRNNCWAETVPAQRTAVAMAASNVDLIGFIFMSRSFQIKLKGRMLALSVHGSLVAGKAVFQIGNSGIIQNSRPDLLHFSSAIHQDCLRGQLKTVIQHHPRIDLL